MNKYILATLFVLLMATPSLAHEPECYSSYRYESYDMCSSLDTLGSQRDRYRRQVRELESEKSMLELEVETLKRKVRDLESQRRW